MQEAVKITLENFDMNKLITLRDNFITDNSKDVKIDDIMFAWKNIKRPFNVIRIDKLLYDIEVSEKIEQGVFEYALVMMVLNNLDRSIIAAIYDDKLQDILLNLDPNSYLKNKMLKSALQQKIINPHLIAFLSPDQLHPESWSDVVDKIRYREDVEKNMATTDMYKCKKCGDRKCKVCELQMRGADEPTSKIVTCLTCYNTFIS
jgi:DNA-directed RNA polymerase subunit M/transcription elongation factor TFIIS